MQKSEEGRSALVDTWQGIAFGAFIGLLLTLLVLCILALLIYSEKISESFGDVFVFISALLGSCVGAVVTIKRRQGRGGTDRWLCRRDGLFLSSFAQRRIWWLRGYYME